jgi:hypothetical protein
MGDPAVKHDDEDKMSMVSSKMLLAGFGYPRNKDSEDAKVLGEVGEIEEGDGARVTLLPHYLLVEVQTREESGELWLPITALLTLIAELHEHTAN